MIKIKQNRTNLKQILTPDKPVSHLNKGRSLKTLDNKIKEILEVLKKRGWYIGVMESCTGGAIANAVTNIPGASDVFKCGLVTYCNEAKIKAGVDEKIIKKYGVYSVETAEEMARKIDPPKAGTFRRASVGVGVSGNLPGEVFVAVRVKEKIVSEKKLVGSDLKDEVEARKEMKNQIVERVVEMISDNL